MPTYIDSNVLIYAVKGRGRLAAEATARLTDMPDPTSPLVVSHLVRFECIVGPLVRRDDALLGEYRALFESGRLVVIGLTGEGFDMAAAIRARYGFRTPDALHLGTAAAHGCEVFLTADRDLRRCEEIEVEVLGGQA